VGPRCLYCAEWWARHHPHRYHLNLVASTESWCLGSVQAQDGETFENIAGSSVILATGGYSADSEGLLAQHAPCLHHLPTTNGPFAQGCGHAWGLQ